jgi:hypothetical protein
MTLAEIRQRAQVVGDIVRAMLTDNYETEADKIRLRAIAGSMAEVVESIDRKDVTP